MANLGQLTSNILRTINASTLLRNRAKLVEGSLFALIDLLTGAKFITLYFKWRAGDEFTKNLSFFLKKKFYLFLLPINFFKLKRQSEHSRLRPDTSSLVVTNFDTKVTEYLCSGWVFFSSDKF